MFLKLERQPKRMRPSSLSLLSCRTRFSSALLRPINTADSICFQCVCVCVCVARGTISGSTRGSAGVVTDQARLFWHKMVHVQQPVGPGGRHVQRPGLRWYGMVEF